MKTRLLSGSSMMAYQNTRRLTPISVQIFRRYPFTTFIVICLILFLTINWYFQNKEHFALSNTLVVFVNKNYKDDYQVLETNREHGYEVTKTNENTEFLTHDLELIEESFVSPSIQRQLPVYRHSQPGMNTFTMHSKRQFDEDSSRINEVEVPTMPYPKSGLFPTLKNDMVADPHNWYMKQPPFEALPFRKRTTRFKIVHPIEGFPVPIPDNEWGKVKPMTMTPSLPRKEKENLESVKADQHIASDTNNSSLNFQKSAKDPVLLVDTPGCKIPKFDPFDETVKDIIEFQDPYVCPGPPVFLKSIPGGSIRLNKTILENYYNKTADELVCYYQPIYREHEVELGECEINFGFGDFYRLEFDKHIKEDNVRVICNVKENQYEQYFPLVRLRDDVEEQRNSLTPPNPALNVLLIGIDSTSKLNFLRHFPKTRAFLKEKLNSYEMNGYTKVGDNTFPNLIPMLTGRFVEYWWSEAVKDTMYFDDIDLIWKDYAKRGYRTFFAEDYPYAGTFQYLKRGFYDPPTDYYFRPLALALETWKTYAPPEKDFCYNSQIDYELIYDYLKDFAQTMDTRPHFGFAMLSTITHDDLNNAGWVDEPTVKLLEGLLNAGSLNNTILVLFSDHGLRYGKIRRTFIGKFEEKLPLMYIHVPKWFVERYPEIGKNLQANQHRLMTLFDLHATMIHQLDLSKSTEERSMVSLGTSLFEEISPNRTCPEAYIEDHFCPCRTFEIAALDSPEVVNASQAIMDDINSKLEPYSDVCEILEVDTITDARVGRPNQLMLQYLRTENEGDNRVIWVGDNVTAIDDYMITLFAKPGGAIFEGTVRLDTKDNSYRVLGLSRLNMYRNTSWCINSPKLKLFCYCKIQNKPE